MPVQNRPLLHWLLDYLKRGGAEAIVLNAHHLSHVLIAHVGAQNFGIPVQVRVEGRLLGTGGGIRNVTDFWDHRPFVVMNGDILSGVDLQEVLDVHLRRRALATLVLTDEPRFNQVELGADRRVLRFRGGQSDSSLAFTGIQVVSPEVLNVIPAEGASSIIHSYERLIAAGGLIMGHMVRDQYWRELGEVRTYHEAHREFTGLEKSPIPGFQIGAGAVLHPSARMARGARLIGMVCIGAGCDVADGATIEDSILWDRVRVGAGCSVKSSIIGDGVEVVRSLRDAVVVVDGG
jgi:NDP-sugar pyrophosphorylase family protein